MGRLIHSNFQTVRSKKSLLFNIQLIDVIIFFVNKKFIKVIE